MSLSMPAVMTATPSSTGVRTVRIGHVLPWPAVGGTEHATLRIARAVEGADFESIVFCLRGADSVVSLFDSQGRLEIAVARGSAAALLEIAAGAPVRAALGPS